MNFQTITRFFATVFLLITIVLGTQAQTVKELETQRKLALKKLEITNKILNETKKSQKSSLNKLTIINKNINERKTLIKNIGSEIGKLDSQMLQLEQERNLLENQLIILKKNYVKLVREAHNNRSMYSRIMFVLSAETFDQSLRRLRYMQEYTNYRKQQVRSIQKVTTDIKMKNDSLNDNKTTKVEVVTQKQNETQKLTKDEQKEKILLTDLKKKEGKLRADLKIQQKKANDLNNKIERIIAEEIRKADAKRQAEQKQKQEEHRVRLAAENKRKAEEAKRIIEENKRIAEQNQRINEQNKRIAEENKRIEKENKAKSAAKQVAKAAPIPLVVPKEVPVITSAPAEDEKEVSTSQSVSAMTKEENLISGDFQRNAGRLPWPTSNGFIRGHFGVQPHPVLKFVTTNNKGIYIQTPSGSNARAVFDGVVSQVFYIQGNNGVIVQHGNYRTVYANLTQIYVKAGDHISSKQSIGKIYTDNENDNKTELYFQVWNGKSILNPESWISR
jgi:septal ring factor EnvC (AmiA/AmiB activator)